ncbi:MAG: M23 family metallopeptidase [Bdellovibrionota bacterium]
MDASKRKISNLTLILLCTSLVGCSFLDPRPTYRFIQYPVQKGDTVAALSYRFQVGPTEILSVNGIANPRSLKAGQFLKIPYHGQSLSRTEADASKPQLQVSEGIPHSKKNKKTLKQITLAGAGKHVGQLAWPVATGKTYISSKFGWRWFSFHEGMDLAGPSGTAVYAAHAGQVVYSGTKLRGYGNIIVIKGSGITTVYGHNRKNHVTRGQFVQKGARIADLGSSGKASGPHLHFETRIKDEKGKNAAIDPLIFY